MRIASPRAVVACALAAAASTLATSTLAACGNAAPVPTHPDHPAPPAKPATMAYRVVADFERAVKASQDAFVDLSREVTANHPGGSFTELMTVYTVVNAVTTNLPAVRRVQILVDGQEADTLAGHVDLRRPLQRDLSLVRDEVQ